MASRVAQLAAHVQHSGVTPSGGSAPLPAGAVVVLAAVRTPICKAKRGALKDTTPDVLLRTVLKSVTEATTLPASEIGDVCVGNVLAEGAGAAAWRMAQMQAGMSYSVPLSAVNRQCSSGLQAVINIAGALSSGVSAGIAAGVESMSTHSMGDTVPAVDWDAVRATPDAWACTIPMGVTNENVAERYGVSREAQDALAVRSHARASAAVHKRAFKAEMVPVHTKDASGEPVVVDQDDGIREGTSLSSLSRLSPSFTPGGCTTAGNASQVSDGAAALLLARADVASRYKIAPLAVLRGWAVVGVPPDELGVGPAVAIPAALARAGVKLEDVDVVELNEAFAAQALYCLRKLGLEAALANDVLPDGRVSGTPLINPLGGAIALGHPLGCTGARQVATLVHFMQRHKLRYGIVSMCIGTGMGAAAVFERL